MHCSTKTKSHNTYGTPENCYRGKNNFALQVALLKLQLIPQHRSTQLNCRSDKKTSVPYQLPCYTNGKTHSKDGKPLNCISDQQLVCPIYCTKPKPQITDVTPHNFYRDQQSVCLTRCPVALTVCRRIQTVHRTIFIVTNSQSALPLALLR